jgi:hypothetical protein
MKEIAISELYKAFLDVHFMLDLHDATFSYCPLDQMKELEKEVLKCLNDINYETYWGFKETCPLTYESMSGTSFRDVK